MRRAFALPCFASSKLWLKLTPAAISRLQSPLVGPPPPRRALGYDCAREIR